MRHLDVAITKAWSHESFCEHQVLVTDCTSSLVHLPFPPRGQESMPSSQISAEHFTSGTHTYIPQMFGLLYFQGINLYHQWQNVLGIHIIWQLLHFAVTFPVTRILGTFSRRFPEDSPGHGSSPCHRCSRVQLPPVCLSPSLTPHIAPCQWFPGTRKKPFHPRDIWFRQADSRQVCECVIR